MSDDPSSKLTEVFTASEAATEAGAVTTTPDPVDELRKYVHRAIDNTKNISERERALAKTKADEMCFWLRGDTPAK